VMPDFGQESACAPLRGAIADLRTRNTGTIMRCWGCIALLWMLLTSISSAHQPSVRTEPKRCERRVKVLRDPAFVATHEETSSGYTQAAIAQTPKHMQSLNVADAEERRGDLPDMASNVAAERGSLARAISSEAAGSKPHSILRPSTRASADPYRSCPADVADV